jgi:hypothetical protein
MNALINFVLSCLLLAATSISRAQTASLWPEGIQHVIVVGVDGMSPDGIRNASTPVMHDLISKGSVKWNVRTVIPSSSSPNWASMIMGAGVEQHGVLDNDWEKDNYSLPAIVRDEEDLFPTIFYVIRKNRPGAEIGAVYHWEGFGRLIEKKALSYNRHYDSADSTTEAFVAYLQKSKPLFAFMHLDHVDHAGHTAGHGTEEYYAAVSKADSLIGEVRKAIRKAGIEGSTLLIITADHGGVGYGHGGASIEEAEIAMILYGKGIKKGYQIPEQVATYDLAATIAFALKIVPPYVWTGRPVKSAFTGFHAPANLWMGKSLIPTPVILPKRYLYQQAGGLYVNVIPEVKIEPVAKNAVTRYTLDGSEPDSVSAIYKKPFALKESAVVKARSFDKNSESLTGTAFFRVVDSTAGNGLKAEFYTSGKDWKYLPVFKDMAPVQTWKTFEFALNRQQILSLLNKDSSTFGIVYSGFLKVDSAGDYTFYNSSDDGSRLFVNNTEVVNNDGNHGVVERSGSIRLSKGMFPIRLEYYNSFGGFWLDAFYKGPGVPKQLIPASKLFEREN